jgi:single-strand DNA-binding protein
VIVSGHVYTSEYEDRDGIRRSTLEMRATAVGPDLSRCIARVEKTVSTGSATGATDAEEEKEPDSAETAPDAEAALPLSA